MIEAFCAARRRLFYWCILSAIYDINSIQVGGPMPPSA